MAYESKVYIVEKSDLLNDEGKKYAHVIAIFDLCKFEGFCDIFKTVTDCYFYADDGNTEVVEDKYGDPLVEATIEDVVKYLENYIEKEHYYRRVAPVLGLLKAFKKDDWNNLFVLHFGHWFN